MARRGGGRWAVGGHARACAPAPVRPPHRLAHGRATSPLPLSLVCGAWRAQFTVEYTAFVDDDGNGMTEGGLERKRLRIAPDAAPKGWTPSLGEIVEVNEDDCWWEARVKSLPGKGKAELIFRVSDEVCAPRTKLQAASPPLPAPQSTHALESCAPPNQVADALAPPPLPPHKPCMRAPPGRRSRLWRLQRRSARARGSTWPSKVARRRGRAQRNGFAPVV